MSSSSDFYVGDTSIDMLTMKLYLVAEKLDKQEQELTVLVADVRKKLSGDISNAKRERLENKASAFCQRIRTMQREYNGLWDRWLKMMQVENVDAGKLELEMKNEEMRLEQEERWETLERSGDYFKTRWG
ncbi:hypothetical protein FVEN_g1050 [Fusarium venenatum]|uniref:Uncharacterized protein n=1 Tax=Fusarium venenatum TaxID=56646 RepID=A0A2L2THJ0_9HYPO|nr:uncharacterized protein FVRRES_10519 [Fusarium venenatum]KAG8361262.1 hypothetical protein FVEN_g1050 [Fusarium venenatum]KAH6967122.1 hypothetical protein EDB82DRAFT_562944 [Fusarium venenatum]CEI70442.1 unnamed protein product [Fusarium venenatum]